jgi:hypothetical protein
MESFAEVGRVLAKVHQGAVERLVDFIWIGISVLLLNATEITGTYRNNPTASQTRAQAGE